VQSNNERERDTLILFFVHLGFHFVLFVVLEIVYRLWRNKSGPLTTREVTKTLTTEEYEKLVHNGGKLCILDDFILDTERYASRHPGGQFLIEATVGRDVSKYFYGGYKMENSKRQQGRTQQAQHVCSKDSSGPHCGTIEQSRTEGPC